MFEVLIPIGVIALIVILVRQLTLPAVIRPLDCPEGRKCPYKLTFHADGSIEANPGEAIVKGCCKFKKQLEQARKLKEIIDETNNRRR